METLFPEMEQDNGYRLQSLEVFNWGGFHNRVWAIKPETGSILVTGANGSGKTTLVDALVTLLVPPGRRHYNQSSGSDKKRDRTEETYVLGAYGSVRSEESVRSSTKTLRDRDSYSILLAVFRNNLNNGCFTLAQIRWFTASGLQRDYITADADLSIQDHFLSLDSRKEYRKNLAGIPGITWHDSFAKYEQHLIRSLGLRSEKALSLFSQIVGVKQIENLNTFIRTHMLEEPGMEEDFHKLKVNYQNLLQTHNKIEMAETQLVYLDSVDDTGKRYKKVLQEYTDLHTIREGMPLFFADMIHRRATAVMLEQNNLLDRLQLNQQQLFREKEKLELDLDSVKAAIAQDQSSGRIREIDIELQSLQDRLETRRRTHGRYADAAALIKTGVPKSEAQFGDSRKTIESVMTESSEQLSGHEQEDRETYRQLEDINRTLEELENEIASLKDRTSNIPSRSLTIRDELARALGAGTGEIPFAGELIQVRPEEQRWETAAEKLLNNFALSILVPERLYKGATAYINSHNLKGKLVYFRVPADTRGLTHTDALFATGEQTLPAKLEVKPDTPFSAWVAGNLLDRFNYLCTDDLDELSHAAYGVTSAGLIKGQSRHEKDDRPGRWDRSRFVLGWDNRKKLAWFMREKESTEKKRQELETARGEISHRIETLRGKIQAGRTILEIEEFREINWPGCARELEFLEQQKKAILKEAGTLQVLKAKEQELKNFRGTLERQLTGVQEDIWKAGQELERMAGHLSEAEAVLKVYPEDRETYLQEIRGKIGRFLPKGLNDTGNLDIGSIKDLQTGVLQKILNTLEDAGNRRDRASRELSNAMNKFLSPGQEISQTFPGWSSDTHHLYADPDYLDDFLSLRQKIQKDELPKYKKEFRDFMNQRMFENIIAFSNTLDMTRRRIIEDLENLNNSLKSVAYSRMPKTCITLKSEHTKDMAVQDFRALLNSAAGDVGKLSTGKDKEEAELSAAFARIQDLILKLSGDDNWRRKVLDVRNWLEFSAVEYYEDSGEQKQYYEDSMSLSGGEKAKLAYTILASAIAYQYGLQEGKSRSFRFIIVDEIFSKVDPENSEYAMELFKAMGLQLMIVTPLDRINIVENHIGTVCFIEKQGDFAVPHILSLEEYKTMQEDALQAEAVRS